MLPLLPVTCSAYEAGEWQAAADAYTEALQVDPAHKVVNIELWLGLCKMQHVLNQLKQALQVMNPCSSSWCVIMYTVDGLGTCGFACTSATAVGARHGLILQFVSALSQSCVLRTDCRTITCLVAPL